LKPSVRIVTNDYLEKPCFPNIFAVGDVAGPYQFHSRCSSSALVAAVECVVWYLQKNSVRITEFIPWATLLILEVARVGLSEQRCETNQGIAYEMVRLRYLMT